MLHTASGVRRRANLCLMSICVICADTLVLNDTTGASVLGNRAGIDDDATQGATDNSGIVRLECGHSFHCKCAIQWFRYNHACCPLCRATHVESSWKKKTPGQRVAIMRRVVAKLPRFMQSKVRKCNTVSTRLATTLMDRRSFRCVHADILKRDRMLERSVRMLTHQKKKLVRELAWFEVEGVPYLHVPSSHGVDDADDADDSDDSDTDTDATESSTAGSSTPLRE